LSQLEALPVVWSCAESEAGCCAADRPVHGWSAGALPRWGL